MNPLQPYLNFGGNCREALQFYSECLGAELTIQTIGESPIAGQFPAAMHNQVLHATLSQNAILLMASDMCGPEGLVQGNNFSLAYHCADEADINRLFELLSEGGKVMMPVAVQFWGDYFATFTDRFGVRWSLHAAASRQAKQTKEMRFSVFINAPKERVWEVLLTDETYRQWTSAFHPGSYAESDWKEGSTALFKTPEGDGMVSRVVVHRPASVITVEHVGILKKGEQVFDDPEIEKWKGCLETYIVQDEADGTRLLIEQDVAPDYVDYMKEAWEKALELVKQLSEAASVHA